MTLLQDLCCKMAFTYSMKAVGWSYKRQETVNLCVSELRPVASDECCHLKDKSRELTKQDLDFRSWELTDIHVVAIQV